MNKYEENFRERYKSLILSRTIVTSQLIHLNKRLAKCIYDNENIQVILVKDYRELMNGKELQMELSAKIAEKIAELEIINSKIESICDCTIFSFSKLCKFCNK